MRKKTRFILTFIFALCSSYMAFASFTIAEAKRSGAGTDTETGIAYAAQWGGNFQEAFIEAKAYSFNAPGQGHSSVTHAEGTAIIKEGPYTLKTISASVDALGTDSEGWDVSEQPEQNHPGCDRIEYDLEATADSKPYWDPIMQQQLWTHTAAYCRVNADQ